jgi:uncharacterized protein YbbC (DUF1343 family)
MTHFGLDVFISRFPKALKGKRIGVLCHAASINHAYEHIVDLLARHKDCRLKAIFGPQHGLFGQTQDNMIEWEGGQVHPIYQIPIFSLYGETRKPTHEMMMQMDALVIDLQDVGARPYTYVWTIKLCIEACSEKNVPVWILDRPNPIAAIPMDGPMLSPEFFSFVGGAPIPLCHRMTIAEIALFIKQQYYPKAQLEIIRMKGWQRNSLWSETGLPWVFPSPNMPTADTAMVYPGMVLLEATNLSEGRGTTKPFELIGSPNVNTGNLLQYLKEQKLDGCHFRVHNFIPTFQKWKGEFCNGIQVHVTKPRRFRPVAVTAAILLSISSDLTAKFLFKLPPYEYETKKLPIDILAGDDSFYQAIIHRRPLTEITESWKDSHNSFARILKDIALYPEVQR